MTKFDEAIDKTKELSMDGTQQIYSDDVIQIINDLRAEYAPTVEMTKGQKELLLSLLDNSDISSDDWETIIHNDNPELPEITYRDAILAYMNPEIIKVVEEEK